MGTARFDVELPMTKEEFEAAYVMWKCGAAPHELAAAHAVGAATLAWMFVMRSADRLNKYTVHYKDPN